MDYIKSFKAYTKLNPSSSSSSSSETENHTSRKINAPRNPLITIASSSIVVLTLIVFAVVGALIYESVTEPPEITNPPDSVRAVCSVTQYPESCFTSISSSFDLPKIDPELIFNLSLRIAIQELKNLSSLPKTLISKSNDRRSVSALKDCDTVFDDAVSQLNRSATAMVVGPGEKLLTKAKISDMKTWISAALTDQETCLDGLEEMGSTVLDEVRVRVQRSKEYMSNSLAILTNIRTVLYMFDVSMH